MGMGMGMGMGWEERRMDGRKGWMILLTIEHFLKSSWSVSGVCLSVGRRRCLRGGTFPLIVVVVVVMFYFYDTVVLLFAFLCIGGSHDGAVDSFGEERWEMWKVQNKSHFWWFKYSDNAELYGGSKQVRRSSRRLGGWWVGIATTKGW